MCTSLLRELKNVPNLSPGTEEAAIIVDGRGKVVALAAPPPQLKPEKPFKFESFYIRIGRRTYEEITRVTKATGIRHVFLQSLKKHKPECSSLKLRGGNEDFCLDEDETGWSELPRYQDYGDTRATPWLLFFVESEHRQSFQYHLLHPSGSDFFSQLKIKST